MTMLYPNSCYNKVCYYGTVLYNEQCRTLSSNFGKRSQAKTGKKRDLTSKLVKINA